MDSSIDDNFKEQLEVPKGYICIMGDNRNNSRDPNIRFVPKSLLLGKVIARVFSFNKMSGF